MDGTSHFIVFLLFVPYAICQNCDCKLVNILRNIVQREMMEREMLVSRVEMLESQQGLLTHYGANSSEYSTDTDILDRLVVLGMMMADFNTKLNEITSNECASNPCLNGATCVDGIQRYTCICLAGYNGTRCEIKNTVCASSPCMNGATCLEVMNNYACKCTVGFEGTNCQIGSLGTTQCMNDTNVIEGDSRTCGEVFGNESICVQGKCACSDGYVPNLTNTACEQGFLGTTQCVDNTNVIKGDIRTCGDVFGSDSACVQGKCACSGVYVPKLNNNTVCEKGSLGTTQCVDNTNVIKGDSRTCRDVFGSESACVQGKCACSDGYVPNLTNTVCEQGYLGRTYCDAHNYLVRRYIRTCEQVFGTGTTCVQGKCVCSASSYVPSLTITACVRVNEAYGRTPISTLSVTNGDTFGDWGNTAYCPPGTFATGYTMKIEPYQGWTDQGPEDDTSLNAIRLFCSDLGGVVRGQIWSLEGAWGDWTPEEPCPKGAFLVSFKLQVESFLGGGNGQDDTSANYVKFLCRDFAGEKGQTELVRSPGHGFWGEWGGWSQTCVPNSAVCGLKTRVESFQREGDDTALNDVIFYCCNQLY